MVLAIMVEGVHNHGGSGYVVDLAKQFYKKDNHIKTALYVNSAVFIFGGRRLLP